MYIRLKMEAAWTSDHDLGLSLFQNLKSQIKVPQVSHFLSKYLQKHQNARSREIKLT